MFHKWCGIEESDARLYVVNNGIYGGSFTDKTIKLSLFRTPMYAAHPVEGDIAPHDRYINHIDMGERHFTFRITAEKNIEREAQAYNELPYLLSFFPSGDGKGHTSIVKIDDPNIIMSSLKKKKDGYVMTLFNSSENETDANIDFYGEKLKLHFKGFELK